MTPIAPPPHTRSATTTDSWITPKSLIHRLGPFDLDPCACRRQPWPCAARSFTEDEDGLLQTWDGFVWCNPPYGASLDQWLNRMALHNNGIALVFARTETKAFFKNVWPHARALLFLRGRITFFTPDGVKSRNGGNSGGPSVLIGYGEYAARTLWEARSLGAYTTTFPLKQTKSEFKR